MIIDVEVAETNTVGAGITGSDTVIVMPWLAVPPAPVHVTLKEVVEFKAPVLKEPLVPVPPPPEDVHEVLMVEFQLMMVLAP